MLELKEHLQRKPANLSGGQRQRVAMGRAIIRQANAFLFDEPLSNLDAKLRGQMRTEISRLQRRLGITTVYVTHDQTEAMTLGDRVAVLRRGVLQQVASPRELYEQPVNLFVAGFIGSPPMNFLPATVGDGMLEMPFVEIADPRRRRADQAATASWSSSACAPRRSRTPPWSRRPTAPRGSPSTPPVDVTEWLGNEKYAYLPFEPHPEVQAALDRARPRARRRGDAHAAGGEPRRRQQGPPGRATRELWFDPAKAHVFDAESGENLTRDEQQAAQIAQGVRRRAQARARAGQEAGDGPCLSAPGHAAAAPALTCGPAAVLSVTVRPQCQP